MLGKILDEVKAISNKIRQKLNDENFKNASLKHMQVRSLGENFFFKSFLTLDHPPTVNLINQIDEKDKIDVYNHCADYFFHVMRIACEFNLKDELHELLEILLPHANEWQFVTDKTTCQFDINTICSLSRGDLSKTLLGLSAHHGQIDIVKYLIKERNANVNAQDIYGYTPLHDTVLGDTCPINNDSLGTDHAAVASFLIEKGADLNIKDYRYQMTALATAEQYAPYWIEKVLGKRIFQKQDKYVDCYGDKVRPILEARQASFWSKNITKTAIGVTIVASLVGAYKLSQSGK